MSEGGGVRVRNGMLVVEGEQIGHCCRDLQGGARSDIGRRCWLCVFPLFECVFECRGSGNLQLKQMVGMLYEIAIDKEYKTQRS